MASIRKHFTPELSNQAHHTCLVGEAQVEIAVEDERLGSVIHLAVAGEDAGAIVDSFNERVLPFERIRAVHRVRSVPRSPLGKLLRQHLRAEIR